MGEKSPIVRKKPTADTFLTSFSHSETHFSHVLRFYPPTKSNYPKLTFSFQFLSAFHSNCISIFKQNPTHFLFSDPSDFHTFQSSYCIFYISNQIQLIFEYKSSFRDSKASCQCSKLFYEYKETLKMEIWELASIYITFSWFSSLPNPFLLLSDYQK